MQQQDSLMLIQEESENGVHRKTGNSKSKRLKGGGRKAKDEDMEEIIFPWINDMRICHLRVSRRMIREKAKTLGREGFKASSGWLQLFMKRKGLSLRRKQQCVSPPQR